MNECFADSGLHVSFVLRIPFDGTLEEHHLVRQPVAVIPSPLGQRCSLIESEEGVRGFDIQFRKQLRRWLVFYHNDDVVNGGAKATRNRRERLAGQLFEARSSHLTGRDERRSPPSFL